jgi:hypothetical protein
MLARDLINNFTKEYSGMKQAGASKSELADFLKNHSHHRPIPPKK